MVQPGLSKNLREALGRMVSKREAQQMSEQLWERLELENAPMVDAIEIDMDPAPLEEWSEGVEHLQGKTPAELYQLLGLEKRTIPFFKAEAVEQDVSGDLGELETSATTTEGTPLRWYQLVRTMRALERAARSEPVLLMDGVGLGKTVQVIAIFAMLAYYREFFKVNRRYPGHWGELIAFACERRGRGADKHATGRLGEWRNYAGECSELPEDPFLIIVPPTLVEQVALECQQFLQPGSFDIIKITHSDMWRESEMRSKAPSYRRIYIATTTVSATFIYMQWRLILMATGGAIGV